MNEDKYAPEPCQKWKRKNYNLGHLKNRSPRERAEIETTRDLSKPIEQLVCDYHDIAENVIDQNEPRTAADMAWHVVQAEKRMVSLMGKVALAHERGTRWLIRLTFVLVVMTAVLIWLTVVLVRKGG